MKPIVDVAAGLGLAGDHLVPYGRYKAKVHLAALEARRSAPNGKLVVVSSITPTPPGDGKTTVTIGLGQGLARIGRRAVVALNVSDAPREISFPAEGTYRAAFPAGDAVTAAGGQLTAALPPRTARVWVRE